MSDYAQLVAENIQLRETVVKLRVEVSNWKSNCEDLAMKLHRLNQESKDLLNYEESETLRMELHKLKEDEFRLSSQLVFVTSENSRLHAVIGELQNNLDGSEQLRQKFDKLKTQYETLQRASQELHVELEQVRNMPPKLIQRNTGPDEDRLRNEIVRLQSIIFNRCRTYF